MVFRDIGYYHLMNVNLRRTEVELGLAAAVRNQCLLAAELVEFGFWHRRDVNMSLPVFLMLSGICSGA